MIFGCVSRWQEEKHVFPKAFDEAMQFLQNDVLEMEDGKYPISGDDIFAMVQRTITEKTETKHPEIHKEYADIHVVMQGRECYVVQPCPPTQLLRENKLATHDIAFYEQDPSANVLRLVPGQYVVFLPHEQHTPCCAFEECEPLCKVVLKIRASLLE